MEVLQRPTCLIVLFGTPAPCVESEAAALILLSWSCMIAAPLRKVLSSDSCSKC